MQTKDLHPSVEQLQELRCAIGRRLRRVRESIGETQEAFARRLGVTKLSVLKYEAGTTAPTCDVMAYLHQQRVDAQHVVFGIPSLANPEQRARFAKVHAWVVREFKVRCLRGDGVQVMEIAWNVFVRLSELSDDHVSDNVLIDHAIQETLSKLKA